MNKKCKYLSLLAIVGFAGLLYAPSPALAVAVAPDLGTAASYTVLGTNSTPTSGTVTCTTSTITGGRVGTTFTSITNTGCTITAGTIDAPVAGSVVTAFNNAYSALNSLNSTCDFTLSSTPATATLSPGVYCFTAGATMNSVIFTLNGSASDIWVFKIGTGGTGDLTGNSFQVVMGGTAQACNVYWRTAQAATMTDSQFLGNILAGTAITLTGGKYTGRALAKTDVTVTNEAPMTFAECGASPGPAPPSGGVRLNKVFFPTTINAGGVSFLTITLSNASTSVATLTAPLTDTLPSGVVIAPTPNASTTCSGTGAPSATAGGSTVTLPATRSIPAGSPSVPGTCTVTVNVTAPAAGSFINTLVAGDLVTSNGTNAEAASATLTVPPPGAVALSKFFFPTTINAGGVSTLTITLSNANTSAATLAAPFTDTLPSGVVIAPTPNAGTTCSGTGAPSATAGGSTVTLPVTRSIPGGSATTPGTCTVTVDVTAPAGGSFLNTLAANVLQTSNGNNAFPASATLTANSPVTLSKAFFPTTIAAGGVSILTITLSNANTTVATLTAPLTDTLPGGVVIAPTPSAGTTCSGTGAPSATAGGSTVTLPATRSIPAGTTSVPGTCTVTVNVTAPAGGSFLNTLAANALQTSNGNNAFPASATLTVPPSGAVALSKSFSPSTIAAGGVSTLTIILSNANTTVATLTALFTDTLPSGVVIAPTPNASTTCGSGGGGGGVVSATAGGATVSLSTNSTIPGGTPGTCTVTVDVTALLGGSFLNTLAAGALQTSLGNSFAPALTTLTVNLTAAGVPTLSKSFSPTTINPGGVSTLTITLSNPTTLAAIVIAPFTDTLPSGVVIATPPNASTTCPGSGEVAATGGGATVTLPATRSIPAGSGTTPGTCTVTVDVTAPAVGSFLNTLDANALQTSLGNNAGGASASLSVNTPPGPQPIPTLSGWAIIMFIALFALFVGFAVMRRQAM